MSLGGVDSRARSRSRSLVEISPIPSDLEGNKKSTNMKSTDDITTLTSTFNFDESKTRETTIEKEKERETTTLPHSIIGKEKKKNIPIIEDDDLTLVEISDMRIAEELMCNRHLRPPLPIGIPNSNEISLFSLSLSYIFTLFL